MIFVLFALLVLVALVVAAVNAQKNWNSQIGAERERIQRTEPDSPLAQLGENEFRLAYQKASKQRQNRAALYLLAAAPFLIGGVFWMLPRIESTTVVIGLMVVAIGAVFFILRWALKSGPTITEVMLASHKG